MAQRIVNVQTIKELRIALKNAEQNDQIILSDGEYDFHGELNISLTSARNKPIILRARNRGKSKIVGESHFILTAAEYIVIEGLTFESINGPAIALYGCNNIHITRNTFHLKETKRGSWILIDGISGDSVRLSHHNRVDHNVFEKKSQFGNFITVEGTMRFSPQVSQYDRIDHNLFAESGPRVQNELEAIRAGAAKYSLSSGFTVVEDNLFERCDGDPEYISIKSSDDTIRRNTFRECLGSLSLRHGNRNTVDGNYILGNGRSGKILDSAGNTQVIGTGGLRFYGNGMRIMNNYIEGCTGNHWDATFVIMNGNAEYGDGQPLTKHFRIHDATITSNLLVNNQTNIEIGYQGTGSLGKWWRLPPIGLHIQNNIIVGVQDTLIKIYTAPLDSRWENNIVWTSGNAVVSNTPINGIRMINPKLEKKGGIWHVPGQSLRSRPLERKDVGPDAE
jgi:parallel beta-helix repeat protein